MIQKNYMCAALYMLGAYTLWVGNDVFSKLSGETLSVPQRAFINQFVATLILVFLFSRKQGWQAFKTRKPWFHVGRGILCCINLMAIYCAVTYMTLANFYTIAFTLPFLIAIISAIVLKEHPSVGVWAAIVIGFFGVIVAVRPTSYDPVSWPLLGIVSMFAANLSFAFYVLTIKWGGKNETVAALTVYPVAISALISLADIAILGNWVWNPAAIIYMSLTGLFFAAAIILVTRAYQLASNAFVASFHYSQIITGGLAGFFIWHDIPARNVVLGAAIIIAAGLLIIRNGDKAKEQAFEAAS